MVRRAVLTVCAAALTASCATRPVPVVAPGPPKYPEFVFPAVPADMARAFPQVAREHELMWRVLQAGDKYFKRRLNCRSAPPCSKQSIR